LKITPIVVMNFAKWLQEKLKEGFDPAVLGIDFRKPETIQKYLEENCADLTYNECKMITEKKFKPAMKQEHEYDPEYAVYVVKAQFEEYFGTDKVSIAFKKMLMSHPEIEHFPPEERARVEGMDLLLEYARLKYQCSDFDVRDIISMINIYGISVQPIQPGTLESFYEQMKSYFGYIDARSIDDLVAPFTKLYVAYETKFIPTAFVCVRGFNLINVPIGTILTTNSYDGVVVINAEKAYIGIIL